MKDAHNKLKRRKFMKQGIGVAGLGSVILGSGSTVSAQEVLSRSHTKDTVTIVNSDGVGGINYIRMLFS